MEQASEIKSVQTANTETAADKKEVVLLAVLEKISIRLNTALAVVAGASMVLICVLITVNVIIRKFVSPIFGINEMVGWLSAITAGFAIGYTQIHRGHVDMDIVVDKFPPLVRRTIYSATHLISMVFFAFVSYQLVVYANNMMKEGTLSETLAVIYYPFIYLLAIGFFGLTLALFVDSIKFIIKGDHK
ncbi:TRAP transporter small permease [Paenibacillus beijingensis]|uniref:TRAP transporter small permease n=1 Tax=Paenibacillus beijingensis TaxID=1126833 RepID=UPI0006977153|nr:TRAP transporter small permease [Paenibacillus beijingensis]